MQRNGYENTIRKNCQDVTIGGKKDQVHFPKDMKLLLLYSSEAYICLSFKGALAVDSHSKLLYIHEFFQQGEVDKQKYYACYEQDENHACKAKNQ